MERATELIRSISIENLLNQRAAFRERVLEAQESMRQARALYDASGIGKYGIYDSVDFETLGMPGFSHPRESMAIVSAEEMIRGFDAVAWRRLMHSSGLKTFMSSSRLAAWDQTIREKKAAEFTMENIQATFERLLGERENMMGEGIVSVFRGLSWSHKTNSPVKFGKKIILRSAFGYLIALSLDKTRLVDDLVRFFHVADGKPQPDHRDNFAALHTYRNAVEASAYESEYIEARGFLNGNLHIRFKRMDLVERMNEVIARQFPGALPAPK